MQHILHIYANSYMPHIGRRVHGSERVSGFCMWREETTIEAGEVACRHSCSARSVLLCICVGASCDDGGFGSLQPRAMFKCTRLNRCMCDLFLQQFLLQIWKNTDKKILKKHGTNSKIACKDRQRKHNKTNKPKPFVANLPGTKKQRLLPFRLFKMKFSPGDNFILKNMPSERSKSVLEHHLRHPGW